MELTQQRLEPAPSTPSASSTSAPPPSRSRCPHVSRNGRPCRYLAVSAKQPFCKNHLPPGSPEELSRTLECMAENFNTPEGVTHVLYTIFFALVDGHISERKAGILTYITQTILHSHRLSAYLDKVKEELEKDADDDIPRNYYGQPIIPYQPPTKNTANSESNSSEAQLAKLEESAGAPSFAGCAKGGSSLAVSVAGAGAPGSPSEPGSSPSLGTPAAVSADVHLQGVGASDPAKSLSSPVSQTPGVATGEGKSRGEKPAPKTPVLDLNHFYPRDPTLPRNVQDPNRLAPPLPAQEELDRHTARFNRAHGFRSSPAARNCPQEQDADWKIINGK